jgi:surface polysaccharide O-acyltransferase-like enzyme
MAQQKSLIEMMPNVVRNGKREVSRTEQLQSKVIAFLRFPLIVGVVFIHAPLSPFSINGDSLIHDSAPLLLGAETLISGILAQVAVPLFFFFSGYLFFYKVSAFSLKVYASKLKKRARTILLPYILWNLFVALFFCSQTSFGEIESMSGNNKLIKDYTFIDWLNGFWAHPFNYPFWFLRNLMIMMAFSPILYYAIKRMSFILPLLLGVIWSFALMPKFPGIMTAFFFFSLGSFFSIRNQCFVNTSKRFLCVSILLYAALVASSLVMPSNPYLLRIGILVGCFAIIAISSHVAYRPFHLMKSLSDSSFFIYAYHAMPLILLMKVALSVFHPQNDLLLVFLYFAIPIIIIIIGVLLYRMLMSWMPRFTRVITGGR